MKEWLDYRHNYKESLDLYECCRGFPSYNDIKRCIDHGSDVESRDENGLRPLHKLCKNQGDIEPIKCLVEIGKCEIDPTDITNRTPLHVACKQRVREIIQYLISKGASITARDNQGWTALHFAAFHENFAAVQFLIEVGAQLYTIDKCGKMPYDLSIFKARFKRAVLDGYKSYYRYNSGIFVNLVKERNVDVEFIFAKESHKRSRSDEDESDTNVSKRSYKELFERFYNES